jgi:replication factor C subunit 1
MNYDIIQYDTGDVRNKILFDNIASNNVSNQNVLHMFTKTAKNIAIVMDEIEGMNSGDKGGLSALIKLVRQKKNKETEK